MSARSQDDDGHGTIALQKLDVAEKELLAYLIAHPSPSGFRTGELQRQYRSNGGPSLTRCSIDRAAASKEISHRNRFWKKRPRNYRTLN